MKFILLLLSFLTILSGCKKADSNINPNAQNVDYEFTITINGLSHKIKGNTVNGEPTLLGPTHNKCYTNTIYGGIVLETNDVSEFNYLSGKVLKCDIQFQNYSTLGVNNARLNFYQTDYWNELTDSLGCYNGAFSITNDGTIDQNIPITITDLGNAPTGVFGNQNHTKTRKGNFNRTLYMVRRSTGKFDVPINISIDFKAVRMF